MSRLTDLLRRVEQQNPALAKDLTREIEALSSRRAFGLNFERHMPESVELPGRRVRRGDKVRFRAAHGEPEKGLDDRLWRVTRIEGRGQQRTAHLAEYHPDGEPATATRKTDDLVVVAEFRDPIYPGLRSTGTVERGGDKPFHTVINAENYHALEALMFAYEGKVDCIYIDPPYNTGAKDWKYNNDYVDGEDAYRHSKWLAMMERRLNVAKRLLSPSGVLIVTIDERELFRLGLLLDQTIPYAARQTVTIVNNPKGVTQDYLSRVDEQALFCFMPGSQPSSTEDDLLTHREEIDSADGHKRPRWKGLLRSGDDAAREDRPNMFFPIWVDPDAGRVVRAGAPLPLEEEPDFNLADDGLRAAWPVRSRGTLGRWGVGSETLNELIKSGYVALGRYDRRRRTWGITYLSEQLREGLESGSLQILSSDPTTGIVDVAYVDNATRRVRTVWHRSAHDAGAHGTDLLSAVLGNGRPFPFPKSLYAVEDCIRVAVGDKTDAIVLDFFAGSGTTAHAVMRLNRQDGGSRRSIMVTNNEVGEDEAKALRKQGYRPGDPEWEAMGIAEYITKPRIRAAITGQTPDGEPIRGDYRFTDEFPMADGFEENVEFFDLTYQDPTRIRHDLAFSAIAPLLWMRAGSTGRRIDNPTSTFDIAETYAVLFSIDAASGFVDAIGACDRLRIAYIVTDDEAQYQSIAAELPRRIETVRLYEAYLRTFEINTGEA